MKSAFVLAYLLLSGSLAWTQTRLNGNTLTLADGRTIEVNSYMKINRPSRGSRFSYIYNELNLRSSGEEGRPSGVAGNVGGKEVTVKRFMVKKGLKGDVYYVITGGSFINNAIDIEPALQAGEVLLPRKRPVISDLSSAAKKGDSRDSVSQASQASQTAVPALPSSGKLMRKPWEESAAAVSTKGLVSRDSVNSVKKQDSSNGLSTLSGRFAREFKHTDSINKAELSHTASVLTAAPATSAPATPVLSPALTHMAPEAVVTPVVERMEKVVDKRDTGAAIPGAAKHHDLSNLMTVPAPEAVTTEEPKLRAGDKSVTPGYDKYTKLKQLKELFDAGVLSKQEFDAEKKKVLVAAP